MRKFLCFFLLFCSVAWANDVRLKEKLTEAPAGSYLVLEQNKTFTFLHVHAIDAQRIIIEEVSIPASTFGRKRMNWKEWFEKGAPGHTCWIMSQVNLASGNFEETFSFTHKGWVDMADSNSFLTTLLNLHFKEVPNLERRRVGLPPGYHKVDRRPIWNPRLIFEGHVVPNALFCAYKARWPADGTELSRKHVEIYLPNPQENASFPLYFPYWLEVEGKIGSARVRVVDSGTGAKSPKGMFPRRPVNNSVYR